jgi:hypothetical protein
MACNKSRWKAANQSKDLRIRRRRRRRRRRSRRRRRLGTYFNVYYRNDVSCIIIL